jgi:hypothetical protein
MLQLVSREAEIVAISDWGKDDLNHACQAARDLLTSRMDRLFDGALAMVHG